MTSSLFVEPQIPIFPPLSSLPEQPAVLQCFPHFPLESGDISSGRPSLHFQGLSLALDGVVTVAYVSLLGGQRCKGGRGAEEESVKNSISQIQIGVKFGSKESKVM